MASSQVYDDIVAILGKEHVYVQPPVGVKMVYPAAIVALDGVDTVRADNDAYLWNRRYTCLLMSRLPEPDELYRILALPYAHLSRTYRADNLNHFVIDLYR